MAEALSVLFMAAIVGAANSSGVPYILFPELGALSSDVFIRPAGKWASEPWKLIATPTATAVLGVLVSSHFRYGVAPILFTMVASIGIVTAMRSTVAPALSAGILPIVLGVTSWRYPLCIFLTLSCLTVVLLCWRRTAPGCRLARATDVDRQAVETLESKPDTKWWFSALFLFVGVMGLAAQFSGWRYILFPPLVVIAYEMLGHPRTCAWAKAPFTFPVVCLGCGGIGVLMCRLVGPTAIAAAVVLIVTFLLLRLLRLRMPPALAIGLIPFVLPHPTWRYAVSVGIGTSLLTVWFMVYRWFLAMRETQQFIVAREVPVEKA